MAIIRIRTLEVLGATIERLCPELQGLVCAGPAEHPKKLVFPSLSIIPIRYNFLPDQDGDIFQEYDNARAVFRVGRYEALLQLRIGAKTARERYKLEHAVSQIFVSQRGRPGILVLQIADCHNATVAFELEYTQWQNEWAFDKEWYSLTAVTAQVPALVERGGIHTIEDLRSCFVEDIDTAFASLPAGALECITIAQDGTITLSSPTP